jgi:hypothetical protein
MITTVNAWIEGEQVQCMSNMCNSDDTKCPRFNICRLYQIKIFMEAEKTMEKAMLSQPMAGKSEEEIVATREKAIKVLKEKGYEIVNTLFTDEWYKKEQMESRGVVQVPLCFLAKSLENMSLCHAAYFCRGWENTRGCKIEHDAAVAYGLDVIYEE